MKKKGIIVYSQGHSYDCGSVLKQTTQEGSLKSQTKMGNETF